MEGRTGEREVLYVNMPLDLFLSTCLVAPVTGSSILCKPTLLDKVTLFCYPTERVWNLFRAGFAISIKLFVCFTLVNSFFLSLYPFAQHTPCSNNFTLQIFIATKFGRGFSFCFVAYPMARYGYLARNYFNLIFLSIKCAPFF